MTKPKHPQIAVTPNPTALAYWAKFKATLPALQQTTGALTWEAFAAMIIVWLAQTDEARAAAVRSVRESEE